MFFSFLFIWQPHKLSDQDNTGNMDTTPGFLNMVEVKSCQVEFIFLNFPKFLKY